MIVSENIAIKSDRMTQNILSDTIMLLLKELKLMEFFNFQSFTIFQDEPSSNTTSNKHVLGRPNNFNDENQPPAGLKHSIKFTPPPPIPIATSSPGKFLTANIILVVLETVAKKLALAQKMRQL